MKDSSVQIESDNHKIENKKSNSKKYIVASTIVLCITIFIIIGILVFSKKTYIVKYDCECEKEIQEQIVNKNESIREPDTPTKDGYVFEYWTYNGEKYDFSSNVTSDILLKAKWKKLEDGTIVVTFDSDGGTEIASQIIKKGEKLVKPENPTKEGFEFEYWLINENEYMFDAEVLENMTLKAKWKELENKPSSDNPISPTNPTTPNNPNKPTNSNSNQNEEYVTCTIKINFGTIDGATAVPSQVLNIKCPKNDFGKCTGNDIQRPSENPTVRGYEFVGWDNEFLNSKPICGSSAELTTASTWRYVPIIPNLKVEYVREFTKNDLVYDLYRFYYSNNSDDRGRYLNLFVSGTGASGLGPDYVKHYVYQYGAGLIRDIDGYNITVNNTNYYQVNKDFSTLSTKSYIEVAILKSGYNHTLTFIAREGGFCSEKNSTARYRYVCDRGIRDAGKKYETVLYSEWSNKIDLSY